MRRRALLLASPLLLLARPASADLLYVLNSGDSSILVLDAATRQEVRRIPALREVHHLVMHPNGRDLLIADSGGNELLIVDPFTGELRRRERDDRRVEPEVALHRALASKRKELNSLVSQYARLKGVPHSHVHADLRRECGGPSLAKASQGEVDERVRAIRAWLRG